MLYCRDLSPYMAMDQSDGLIRKYVVIPGILPPHSTFENVTCQLQAYAYNTLGSLFMRGGQKIIVSGCGETKWLSQIRMQANTFFIFVRTSLRC